MQPIEHFTRYLHHFVQPSNEQLTAFLEAVTFKEVKKNDFLVRAGDVCDSVWFVHEGILRHYLAKGEQ